MDDQSRAFRKQISCYYCEDTKTMITVTDGEVELLTQEPPAQILKRYPKARLMTFEEAMRLYLDSTLMRQH